MVSVLSGPADGVSNGVSLVPAEAGVGQLASDGEPAARDRIGFILPPAEGKTTTAASLAT